MTNARKLSVEYTKTLTSQDSDQLRLVPPYHVLMDALQDSLGGSVTSPVLQTPRQLLDFLLSMVIKCLPFDEAGYLEANPDVRRSIELGDVAGAKEHFCRYGYFEHRVGGTPNIDEAWYQATNPDVAEAIRTGAVESARDHYSRWGAAEWRAPNRESVALIEFWRSLLVPRHDAEHVDP
jgi:hypothetical protein